MGNLWISRVPLVNIYWYNDCLPPYVWQGTEWPAVVIDFQEFSYCWIAHVCQHFVCDSIWCWRLLVFQLFDKFPKLLIIAFKIQGGCFGFASFHWNASVCFCNLTHIYNIIMAVLKLIKCSCVSDVPCSSLRCKGKSQKLSCTILCVCHCRTNCNNG